MQKIDCTAKSKNIVKRFHNKKIFFYPFKNIITFGSSEYDRGILNI